MTREDRGVLDATATWILVSQVFDKEIKRLEEQKVKHLSKCDAHLMMLETLFIESIKNLKHDCYCAAMGVNK